jgi:hypothetical protein
MIGPKVTGEMSQSHAKHWLCFFLHSEPNVRFATYAAFIISILLQDSLLMKNDLSSPNIFCLWSLRPYGSPLERRD